MTQTGIQMPFRILHQNQPIIQCDLQTECKFYNLIIFLSSPHTCVLHIAVLSVNLSVCHSTHVMNTNDTTILFRTFRTAVRASKLQQCTFCNVKLKTIVARLGNKTYDDRGIQTANHPSSFSQSERHK